MILGVKDQNKALSAAGKQPKDTSHRTLTANKYAAKISSSKSPARNVVSDSRQKIQATGKSDKLKGSFEGMDNSSSTYIQMNGTGYDNKSQQKARYSKDVSNRVNANFIQNSFNLETKSSIINNYSSSTMKDSSSDRLKTIIRNNMMFK
jgi:hypothetical protein